MQRGNCYFMQTIRVLAAAFCLAAISWAGAQRATPVPAPAHSRSAAPAGTRPRLSDAQVEATIRAKFAKSKINADKFTVKVQGGVATIEGKTDVIQHKGTATRMAKTGGALAVNNHVQISQAARDRANANLAKGRRRAQIKRGTPAARLAAMPPRPGRALRTISKRHRSRHLYSSRTHQKRVGAAPP